MPRILRVQLTPRQQELYRMIVERNYLALRKSNAVVRRDAGWPRGGARGVCSRAYPEVAPAWRAPAVSDSRRWPTS